MKKIININLSGRVIPIEDSAYEKLQVYIESLRRYFAHEEGRDEIINDIESRIAELLHDKIRKGSPAATDTDIEEIIASMGKPEDFEAENIDAEPTQASSKQYTYTGSGTRMKGRLYRDSSDKILGGVCSGIASYLNVDPAIIRILFAVITLGGFGLGILAYLVLWMVIPAKDVEGFTGKRLFRNPDDRVIGGVAGGLAAYFNKSSRTIRFIFALPIIANIIFGILNGMFFDVPRDFFYFPNIFFGSFTSTFIVIYIILWIVLPEASSPYEKMEMRGEKVDVNTIRQNVQEGVGNVKDKMKAWGDEVKDSAENLGARARAFSSTQGKAFATEFGETARSGSRGLGHAIGVLFKVFFLFIAGTIAFALFVALIGLIFGGIAWWPVNDFLWTSKWQQIYAWGTLLFFIVVPLVAFITWVVRRLLRVRSRHSYLGWTFGFLWTIGWIAAILLAVSIAKDFRIYGNTPETVAIQQPTSGKLIVAVSQPELQYKGNFNWIDEDDEDGWDLSNDTLRLSTVRFNIIPSNDSLYHVTLRRHSFGRTRDDAEQRASKIQYSISSRDSVLDLANGYAIDKESKFRGQQVEVEIAIPFGKMIRFDESVNDKLNPADVKVRRRYRDNRGMRVEINDDYWRQFRPGVDYIMGVDGKLKDMQGRDIVEEYRYPENDSIRIQRAIEQKKKEIKDLEEKQQPVQQRDRSFKKPAIKVEESVEGAVATNSKSTIISLVNWF